MSSVRLAPPPHPHDGGFLLMGVIGITSKTLFEIQSNPVNTDSKGAIESDRFSEVSVGELLIRKKVRAFPRDKAMQTVRNNRMSVKRGLSVLIYTFCFENEPQSSLFFIS